MKDLKVVIHGIKGIKHGIFEITLDNNLYALVGNNGSGKSSIMLCLAQLFSKHNLGILRGEDFSKDSYIEFTLDGVINTWFFNFLRKRWEIKEYPNVLSVNGTYEGSLFYGNRFKDSKIIDEKFADGLIGHDNIVPADPYVQEKLGEILHNDQDYYKELRRIRNKRIADKLGVANTPYFLQIDRNLISQYRMSSGECLLISLLHFIYNSLERRSLPENEPVLMLIDEIELALHPVAVSRFIKYIQELLYKHNNLTVLVTSHAPEVIRMINPVNMYKLERNRSIDVDNDFNIINPCYPSYAIRDVYKHSGYDFLILVEDKLAKKLVENIIDKYNQDVSKLVHVIPVGGWENVLSLHSELTKENITGDSHIISVLDGDVEGKVTNNKNYTNLPKIYLPVESIEKFLHKRLIRNPDQNLQKNLQDKIFRTKSLEDILKDYKKKLRDEIKQYQKKQEDKGSPTTDQFQIEEAIKERDESGKRLYKKIKSELPNITEDNLLNKVFDIIDKNISFDKFACKLRKLMKDPYGKTDS